MTPTELLDGVLDRLRRPYSAGPVVALLVGVPVAHADAAIGAVLATSPEVTRLLDAMPDTLRSISLATTGVPARCRDELRGPVLWAETMSVRSASSGDPAVFVCADPTRAYDSDASRVLVAALEKVRDSGRLHEAGRDAATAAERYLAHRTLLGVTRRPVSGRVRQRAGRVRRHAYRPALDVLERAGDLLRAEDLVPLLDEQSAEAAVRLLRVLAIADAVAEARHEPPPKLGVRGDELVGGSVSYRRRAGRPQVAIGRVEVTATATDAAITAALRLASRV